MLTTISSNFGKGGSGLDKLLRAILVEQQGLTISLLAGATASTKMDLAAIRDEDTVIAAVHNTAGTLALLTDVTIVDLRASGTITFTGVPIAAETITVNAKIYTFIAAVAVRTPGSRQINLGTDEDTTAANVVAVVNEVEAWDGSQQVRAAAVAGVVTITAVAEGTGGNAFTLAESATTTAVSGAVLSGGNATGGVKSGTDISTDQLLLVWFNKR
jgi:hypothetical protein